MRFPWRNKDKDGESADALRDAEKNLRAVQRRGKEVTSVAKALREMRERNHFAEQMEEIIVRRRGQLR
jgi:hypothetical protein